MSCKAGFNYDSNLNLCCPVSGIPYLSEECIKPLINNNNNNNNNMIFIIFIIFISLFLLNTLVDIIFIKFFDTHDTINIKIIGLLIGVIILLFLYKKN